MEEEIYEIYLKVKDKCSEKEFLDKMEEYKENEKDNPFINDKDIAESVVCELDDKEEEVESIIDNNPTLKIANLEVGNSEINVIGRVMSIGNPRGFSRKGKPGRVCKMDIADETGTLTVTLWTENMKLLKQIEEGDVIRLNTIDIKEGFRGGIDASCRPRTSLKKLNEEDYPDFPKYSEEITNISDIQPDTEVNIIGRIIRIPPIRNYEKDGKEKKMASIELQDATGTISYKLWNNSTDLIKTLELKEGSAVKILKARSNEYNGEISLSHWDGRIIPGDHDVPEFLEKIEPIGEVREKKDVTVIGIVTKVQDPITFSRNDGSEGQVRSIEIADKTGSVKVTLWNDSANMVVNKGDIIKVSGGDGEFDDYSSSGYRINTNWNSSFTLNPDVDDLLSDELNEIKSQMGPISLGELQNFDEDGEEIDVIGRIITVSDIHEFQRDDGNIGLVRSIDFSDGEAKVQLSFWGERAREVYKPGDAYLIENARTKMGMYSVDLNVGKTSRVIKLSEDKAGFLPSFETIQQSIFDFKTIDELDEDDRDVIVVGRIFDSYPLHEFQRDDGTTGYVKSVEISDQSAVTIRLTLWDNNAKREFELGEAIKVQNPSVRYNDDTNRLELSLSRSSSLLEPSENELIKLPTFEEIKNQVYKHKSIESLEDEDTNVIITGQFIDPYPGKVLSAKCPFCNNNIEFTGEDEYFCDFCGEVVDEPKYLLMIPGKIEDDTGEISITFFDDLAAELLEMSKEEIINLINEDEDYGVLEGKVESLEGITLEVLANVGFDEYNEQSRLRPKKILNKYL